MNLNLGDTQLILSRCRAHGLTVRQSAYILATALWETAHTMRPVRETLADTDASAVARLERAWAAGKLPWVRSPYWRFDADRKSWLGRGYVQLTHKTNYINAGRKLGKDLTTDPDVVMQSAIAAEILVRGSMEGWFTKHKLPDHVNASRKDYISARRVINGTDKAAAIAKLAQEYETDLIAANQNPIKKETPSISSLWALIVRFLQELIKKFRQ